MLLVGQLDSPFVRRVAITLQHHGFDYEREAVSVFKDFDRMRTLNPLGKVPALRLDDGDWLFDSRMILDYVDGIAPAAERLVPVDQPERRRAQTAEAVALGLAEKSVELRIELYRKQPIAHDQNWIQRLEQQVTSALAWLEAQRPDPWLRGSRMTQADVTAVAALTYARHKIEDRVDLDAYPALEALRQRCESLPAFTAAAYSESEAVASH